MGQHQQLARRLVILVLVGALTQHMQPASSAITWFTFYDFWIDTALEKPPYSFNFTSAAQFINLPTVDLGVNLQDWKNFARWQELGGTLDVMWNVEKAGVFTPPCAVVDCSKVKMSGLVEGWEQKLDHAIIEAKALEFGTMPSWSTVNISTRAWFLGDELLENGISMANLTAVARHIKAQWGATTKVYLNMCLPSFIDSDNRPSSPSSTCTGSARCAGGQDMPGGCCLDTTLPPEIDYISFDFYSGNLVDQHGKPGATTNKSSPFYCPTVAGEAACVSAILKKFVYPKLHPHQQAFVVPGLFGARAGDLAEDAALVSKFENYWSMAAADDRIIGLNPWHYDWDKPMPSSPWQNQYNAGAQQYPKLMAAMMTKSALLPGLHGNPEPWKHVLPSPNTPPPPHAHQTQ